MQRTCPGLPGRSRIHRGRAARRADGVPGPAAQLSRRLGLHGADEHAAQSGQRPVHDLRARHRSGRTLAGARFAEHHVRQRKRDAAVWHNRHARAGGDRLRCGLRELRLGADPGRQVHSIRWIQHAGLRRRRAGRQPVVQPQSSRHRRVVPRTRQQQWGDRVPQHRYDGSFERPAHHCLDGHRQRWRDGRSRQPLLQGIQRRVVTSGSDRRTAVSGSRGCRHRRYDADRGSSWVGSGGSVA